MEEKSFTAAMKEALAKIPVRTSCCATAFCYALCRYALLHTETAQDGLSGLCKRLFRYPAVKEATALALEQQKPPAFACEECAGVYVRGAFLRCGHMTDPARSYHLEFCLQDKQAAQELQGVLCELSFEPGVSHRGQKTVLYYKSRDKIQDVLTCIGAQQQVFAVANTVIRRDLRNEANRLANCDAANLAKSATAASPQLRAIRALEQAGRLDSLPEELAMTARLRLQYPEASLPELAKLHPVSMTKSGVYHRLQKILALAQTYSDGKPADF